MKIIQMEKTVSKMKDQKAAAVVVSQKQFESNDNMLDHSQSRAYDDLVSADNVDAFSYNEIDYNGENDSFNK